MRTIKYFFVATVILLFTGCTISGTKMSADSSSLLAYAYSSSLNARVIEIIQKEPLNLRVRLNEGSRIETAPKVYEGEEYGVLWWKHRWQEQTIFTILIRPNDIGEQSVLEVYAVTSRRKNSSFQWEVFDTTKNEKRATEVMNFILTALGGGNVG